MAQKIEGIHAIAAVMSGMPEIKITSTEAEQLSKAVIELTRYYNFAPQGPMVAWINLVGVAAVIYVPRVAMIGMKKAKAKKEKRTADASTVMPEGMQHGAMRHVSADLTQANVHPIKWPENGG